MLGVWVTKSCEAAKAQQPPAHQKRGLPPVTAPLQAPVTTPEPRQWPPPSRRGTPVGDPSSANKPEPTFPTPLPPTQHASGEGGPRSAHPQMGAHHQPYPLVDNLPAQAPTPIKASKGQRKFHLTMGAIFLFLTVGMFILAVIGAIILPASEFWIAPVALAWLAALIQIPVWIIWSIKRSRRNR